MHSGHDHVVCAPGHTLNGLNCEECAVDTYKATAGNGVCASCESYHPGSSTIGQHGAENSSMCGLMPTPPPRYTRSFHTICLTFFVF
jgi:hypothetical protein